jgi:phospholipase A-2-activating protein
LFACEQKDAFMQYAHAQSVVSAAFMDQAGMQILTGGLEGMIQEWAFNQQLQAFQRVKAYEGHARAVTCLLYIPELNLIWSGSQDTTIRVWNAETAECVAVITAVASVRAVCELGRVELRGTIH